MPILISCEAGGDELPEWLSGARKLPKTLASDSAARYVSRRMSANLSAPLIEHRCSLDLIDVTKSLKHRQLFPPAIRKWPPAQRQQLIDDLYQPYRDKVHGVIAAMLKRFPYVIHLSIRSFPLRQSGKLRRADVGLLYDPSSDDEVDVCADWLEEMYFDAPMLKVRRNYPRRGTTESLTKSMRAQFAGQPYIGIEVLINHHWSSRQVSLRDEAIDGMCQTLREVIQPTQANAA